MDKQKLIEALDAAIAKHEGNSVAKVILGLTKQVWQIDWTVAPFDIISHYLEFDIPYFYRFMSMDLGDEKEEEQLLMEWISSRNALNKESKANLPALVEELNRLRVDARNS
ncbi:hypothetical protein [Aphanothece sacrum]|uniref:Uncharacterized protein n=1 Tax=Aphanothece sacrum FPU1 TaxID=1920663 RepID=A0A401IMU0_APHSA|nr:hypothetical protein [Aphanothece sacrum]GBF82556.1 hypothetical protein AsFPU1_3986 [Aphanothece sacrum FPU1]GBF84690.1 hypothetical protein AsFPU3_1744 [Aphanothece sacrum FPU3]